MQDLILQVDKNDNIIGEISKKEAHLRKGILHRAFLAMVFNEKGQLLLAKRSKLKKLWPDFWDGSIASHPKKGELQEQATKRRMIEELGVKADEVKYLFKFHYQISYKNIGSENEICAVLKVKISNKISPNPEEISDYKWMDIENFKKDLNKNPEKYAPWLKIGFEKYLNH